jgi:hypothetical protein
LQRLALSDREDPFAAAIRCTADPAKADKRTRSKWSRVMRYAAAHKPDSKLLDQFIQRRAASMNVLLAILGGLGEVEGFGSAGLSETLLRRFSVRRHQPETVFGVLVVVLRRNESLAWYF